MFDMPLGPGWLSSCSCVKAESSFIDFEEFSRIVEEYRVRHLRALEQEYRDYVSSDCAGISPEDSKRILGQP